MDPEKLLKKHYKHNKKALPILLEHSRLVRDKALEIVSRIPDLFPDRKFIEEAAMLHDIGIKDTKAEDLGCDGTDPYIMHGIRGGEILEGEGLPKHALVAERHVGMGLSEEEIGEQSLPLPQRDMRPQTIEEEIVCFADKFFSKNPHDLGREKSKEEIRESLRQYGPEQLQRFDAWCEKFQEP